MSTSAPQELALISKAERMLAQAQTIDEILHIENLAQRAKEYAKQAGLGRRATNEAAKVMLDARRKAGVTLVEMKRRGELAEQCNGRKASQAATLTINDIGLTRSQSSRYQQEASVPEEEYRRYVQRALESEDFDLTASGLRKVKKQIDASQTTTEEPAAIHSTGVYGTLQEIIATGTKFGCIYADPPWKYGNQGTRAATDNHYSTMTVEQICEEPVSELSAESCHLHLWTTNAFLFDAKRVIDAWGFEYKSCLVWVKPQMGIGNYWRVSHEFLLLGVKGKAPFCDHSQMSWVEAKRTKHSRKPPEIRGRIETVSRGPYLEMYGRERMSGWMVYGNQVSTERSLI